MAETISSVLLLVGASFLLLASIGIIRMPDVFSRMQASAKAATLGIGCMILAVGFYFGNLGITIRVLLVITFFFITAPVAAHMIARAAYFVGVPLYKGTIVDELSGNYDLKTHDLRSPIELASTPESSVEDHRFSK